MQKVELTIQTLNRVLGYLAKRPWDEANSLINAVHDEIEPQLKAQKEEPVGGTD